MCKPGYKEIPEEKRTDSSEMCEYICKKSCVYGECIAPDVCECKEGYSLSDFDIFTCEPKCSEGCINGICLSPETCLCYSNNYTKISESECVLECDPPCDENGHCVQEFDNTSCKCSEGYKSGVEKNSCVPSCSQECIQGDCTGPETCTCHENYRKKIEIGENMITIPLRRLGG